MSTSTRKEELLLSERYSCCCCLNVVTGAFFVAIIGFTGCTFYLLAMILIQMTYNIVPAAFGLINYSFLLAAQLSKRPCFYLIFITMNVSQVCILSTFNTLRFWGWCFTPWSSFFWDWCCSWCPAFTSILLRRISKETHMQSSALKVGGDIFYAFEADDVDGWRPLHMKRRRHGILVTNRFSMQKCDNCEHLPVYSRNSDLHVCDMGRIPSLQICQRTASLLMSTYLE